MLTPDGVQAAADREKQLHPTAGTTPITAWQRRADTIKAAVAEVNKHDAELAQLRGELARRPF